jgi:hypothetical protein
MSAESTASHASDVAVLPGDNYIRTSGFSRRGREAGFQME